MPDHLSTNEVLKLIVAALLGKLGGEVTLEDSDILKVIDSEIEQVSDPDSEKLTLKLVLPEAKKETK
jgi:hypothetical protein